MEFKAVFTLIDNCFDTDFWFVKDMEMNWKPRHRFRHAIVEIHYYAVGTVDGEASISASVNESLNVESASEKSACYC